MVDLEPAAPRLVGRDNELAARGSFLGNAAEGGATLGHESGQA